jgi:HrpA-like RNA helicase
MPGLAEIEQLSEAIRDFLKSEREQKEFEILNVHSSIIDRSLNDKLEERPGKKHKIIIATNIAESSITILGVSYVIDFCLTKEVRFDLKSRMENLELVWASQASCNQRAGRTGRVCDGTIIRLIEKKFFDSLPTYSTPEMQRSSLDKLILRIKMLHEEEKSAIFADPGEVLGSAIQPPHLKNIDTAINSLKFSGGLEWRDGQFHLTKLGRLYVDVPIDITYCKLLVISQLFGTYEDILTLVSILSQSKNILRRYNIDKKYTSYYDTLKTDYNCDFLGLLALY